MFLGSNTTDFETPTNDLHNPISQYINLTIAIVGTILCFSAATLTFSSVTIRNKFLLFGTLYTIECIHALVRVFSSAARIYLIQQGTLGNMIPVYRCACLVYPVLIAVAMAGTTMATLCIAVNVFLAVAFPSFYRIRITTKVVHCEIAVLLTLIIVYATITTVMVVSDESLISNSCFIANFIPAAVSFGLPLLVDSTTCLLVGVTIFKYRNHRRMIPQNYADSNDGRRLNTKRFIRWLNCVIVFIVVFNQLPIMSFFMAGILSFTVNIYYLRLINLLFSLKTIFLPLSCFNFTEYRSAICMCLTVLHVASWNTIKVISLKSPVLPSSGVNGNRLSVGHH